MPIGSQIDVDRLRLSVLVEDLEEHPEDLRRLELQAGAYVERERGRLEREPYW